ncbi:MAG: DUF2752 domain-containing protein [Armatimonadetes bacterium]|nr:DUF2752 domain-containing protein [Armatimonadota bacterium]
MPSRAEALRSALRGPWLAFTPVATRREVWPQLALFLSWLAGTLLGAWIVPSPRGHGSHEQLGLPACSVMALLHRPCPGCGLTTSVSATLRGRLAEAFRAHPFGPPLYALATFGAALALWGWSRRLRVSVDTPPMNALVAAVLGAFLLYGAARFVLWLPR